MKDTYLYSYSVDFVEEDTKEHKIECGILFATTYVDCMDKICNWYGEEYIDKVNFIKCISNHTCIALPIELIKEIEQKLI